MKIGIAIKSMMDMLMTNYKLSEEKSFEIILAIMRRCEKIKKNE